MSEQQRVDVEAAVDGQKIGFFNLNLLFWSFLALFADGFEISALGLAAPHMVREWGAAPGGMGPMMSASLFGVLIGAPLFGYIGDRFGRRLAIILSCALFGVFTLAVVAATNIDQITVLRFITGTGMGGLLPNVIALNSEMAPARLRARAVILMFLGITLGGAVPGFVAAACIPEYGWKSLFWVGGLVPLLVALGLVFFLPESVKFLALRASSHQGSKAALVRLLKRMRPDLEVSEASGFVAAREEKEKSSLLGPIFSGRLAAITLLIWVLFSTTLMSNYFLNSWLPVLIEAKGVDAQTTALITTTYHFGAIMGGIAMSFLFDRWSFVAIAALLAASAPAMLLLALPGVSDLTLGAIVTLAGFCVLGAQFGNNAASGLVYPTAYRSKGVGLAVAAGRIGSISGPIIGASLIGAGAPLVTLLGVMAVTLGAGAIAGIILAWLAVKRFGSLRLNEADAQ